MGPTNSRHQDPTTAHLTGRRAPARLRLLRPSHPASLCRCPRRTCGSPLCPPACLTSATTATPPYRLRSLRLGRRKPVAASPAAALAMPLLQRAKEATQCGGGWWGQSIMGPTRLGMCASECRQVWQQLVLSPSPRSYVELL
jgi:hypothetical protein